MGRVRMSTGRNRNDRQSQPGAWRSGWSCGMLGMLCVLLWVAGGCGIRTEEEATENVTELQVIYSSGDIRWTGSMEWVAEQFMEANPDIRVTLKAPTDVEGQSFTDRLKAMIAQDGFYDVVELREAARFAGAGYLMPLPESLTDLLRPEEKGEQVCYAIPRYTTTLGMIYDRGLFRRLGLSEPESYEEFLDICEKIRQAGVSPVAVGGADLWHMGFWGNHLYQNEILDACEEADWSKERTGEMLKGFRSLSQEGYIEARFSTVSDSQTVQELSSGSAAMLYSGPWIIDQVLGLDPEKELGFFYLPGKDGRTRVPVDRSVTWGISARTAEDEARVEAAVRFLRFFYSEGIYEHVLAQMNAEPVTVRVLDGGETMARQMVRKAAKEGMSYCDRLVGDAGTPDGFRSFYDQCLQEVLWGGTPVEDIAKELEERWER